MVERRLHNLVNNVVIYRRKVKKSYKSLSAWDWMVADEA